MDQKKRKMNLNRSKKRKLCFVLFFFIILLPFYQNVINYYYSGINESNVIKKQSTFHWNQTILNYGVDEGNDLVNDQDGNIIVTGSIFNSSKNALDIIIVKYDSNGDILWNKTWGGNFDDSGLSVTTDSSNNIYVTGYSKSFEGGSYDICLLKYSSGGDLFWNKIWGGNNDEKGYSVKLDSLGNVFIGGYLKIENGYDDVVLLKYDSINGNFLENRTWGEFYDDRALDIVIDSSNNIYLTGYTDNFEAIVRDLFLIKYNSTGDLVYNKTYGDTRWHEGRSLTLDSNEDIIICGSIQNLGVGGDFLLFKLNKSTGELIWNKYWGGEEHDYAYDLALDSKGNILIAGSTESYDGLYKKACFVKFNATGHYKWIQTFSNNIEDVANGIILNSVDEIYVTGKTNLNETDYDIYLLSKKPTPFNFNLSSDATTPDIDGNFVLTWQKSIEAKNYSLFQSNETITDINENVKKILEGNTNRTHSITNLDEGIYFFKVFAYNEYGNTSSTEIEILVKYSPADFKLYTILPEINNVGNINLSWEESPGAVNYSLYFSDNFIDSIHNKGSLIIKGLKELNYSIPYIFPDGTFYFVILAYNDAGITISNCENVSVQKLPTQFSLSKEIEPEDYDDDGNFFLTWTKSNYSQNYTIYRSTSNITDLNDDSVNMIDVYVPDFDWPNYRFSIYESRSDTYYYMVVANNIFGNYSTACIEIKVKLAKGPSLNILLILLIISIPSIVGVGILIFILKRKNQNQIRESINEE